MRWCWSLVLVLALNLSLWAEDERDSVVRGIDDFPAEEVARIIQPDPDRRMPWVDGEVLTYALGWSWFDVGTTEMTITATEWEGQPAWKFTLKTQTNRFADNFYRVRNEVQTYANRAMTRTLYFENDQREGNRSRHYEVPTAARRKEMGDDSILHGRDCRRPAYGPACIRRLFGRRDGL